MKGKEIMLNAFMFKDKKDAEIARLKMAIEDFKKYDAERKSYYAKKMQRLGELESLQEEMYDLSKTGEDPQAIIATQKETIRRLNKLIQIRNISAKRPENELNAIISYDNLKKQNERLRKDVNRLHKHISELITELAKYKKEEEKIASRE